MGERVPRPVSKIVQALRGPHPGLATPIAIGLDPNRGEMLQNRQVRMRCRYHALLQIVGFLAVVAFHSEVTFMGSGWFAVELFFALAGYNMVGALQQRSTLPRYAWARYRRLALPLLLLVPAVALLVTVGSSAAATYAVAAPLQLHNLTRVAMTEVRDLDMAWMPTWFVAALFQLQLLAFLLRRVLVSASLKLVLSGTAALGLGFRYALGEVLDGGDGSLSFSAADALYWAPITHVEALVGGVLLGLGRFNSGRIISVTLFACLGAFAVTFFSEYPSLAFPLGLGDSGEHVWGYLVLATFAVVLIDKRQPLARWVLGWQLAPSVDRAIAIVSQYTFVAYLAHGSVLAVSTYALQRVSGGAAFLVSTLGPIVSMLFVVTTSMLISAMFARLLESRRRARVAQ